MNIHLKKKKSEKAGIFFIILTLFVSVWNISAENIKGGGIELSTDVGLNITRINIDNKDLSVKSSPFIILRDVDEGRDIAGTVKNGNLKDGIVLYFDKLSAEGILRSEDTGKSIRFYFTLKGETKSAARGMQLKFSLPFDATGWYWHNNIASSEKIEGKIYENIEPLRLWADMPEFKDAPKMKSAFLNKNFCTVLTGVVGLCLAVPIDKPCFFRTLYNGSGKKLELVYDFALSPDTRNPNQVGFVFDLYSCDSQWGFRSALDKYYELYPELFRRYINNIGQWMAFSKISDIDNANEFYFALHEGAQWPDYDDKIGVLSFKYFAHAGMPARLENYDPEKDALPADDILMKAVENAFKKETKKEDIYREVGLFNEKEKFAIDRWSVYGHLIAQFNLSPELSYGRWMLEHASDLTLKVKKEKKAVLDGFYYDGLPMGTNYRKEHFKYADYPCIWNPVLKKPFLYNFFSSCEFARALSEQLRPNGQYTMLNGFADNFFIAPWLDVLGGEPYLNILKDDLSYARTKSYQKPLLTVLKGNFARELKHCEIELFMKRCMAYGIVPGFFDWPPSGLGPGGRYWDHPGYYERDRELFRKYLPLCIELAKEGWQPLTYIKSGNLNIRVERFGKGGGNIFWFTVQNTQSEKQNMELSIDLKGLGFTSDANIIIFDALSGNSIPYTKNTDGTIKIKSEISPDEILLLQAGKPEMVFDWWRKQAVNIIERGIQMRELDKNKPPLLVHWINTGKVYKQNVDASGNKIPLLTEGCGLEQWAMLFQKSTEELTLKIRAKATSLEGKEKTIGVNCASARVTSQFTYYENQFCSLPDGTYDWKDFEFKINPSKPLRSIKVSPIMDKTAKGKLEIAEISLRDKKGNEYIVDPNFREWYEPQPDILKNKIENDMKLLKDKIKDLSSDNKNAEKLFDVYNICGKTVNDIKSANIENGCRRVIRDIDTVKSCLNYCMLISAGINIPRIAGPAEASPGDNVSLDFSSAASRDNDFKIIRTINDKEFAGNESEYKVTIPANAVIGSVFSVKGISEIILKDKKIDLPVSHEIKIVPPFSSSIINKYADCAKSEYVVTLKLISNSKSLQNIRLNIALLEGMKFDFPAEIKLSPNENKDIKVFLNYEKVEKIRDFSIKIRIAAGNYSNELTFPVLIIPAKANLIKNPAFEDGLNYWHKYADNSSITVENGQNVLQIKNDDSRAANVLLNCVEQGVILDQKTPTAFYIKGTSKGININGQRDRGYSLYADIRFQDGSKCYGQTYNFKTGTHDWEDGILYIEPQKPVKGVTVALCHRKKIKGGCAFFDNIILAEDAMRKNNIAPDAKVSVDSSFGEKYNAKPINDNKIQTADLAWYEHSWCSLDNTSEHYVAFDFDKPVKIGKVNIFWSLEGKEPMTSREIIFQVWDNGAWKTVKNVCTEKPEPFSEIHLAEPAVSNKFRLLQPSEKGAAERPGVMWLREVELIECE